MKQISLFKKIRIFQDFKKIIRSNKTEMEQIFGARVDKAYRIYNIINIPIETVGEPYNLRKSDIDLIAEKSIKEYTTDISKFLNSKGLHEMYNFYEVKKVDKYSYLVVIGFSLFKSDVYFNNIKFKVVPIMSIMLLLIAFILLSI